MKAACDEKTIQILDAQEHNCLWTGMYIGRLGDGSNPIDDICAMLVLQEASGVVRHRLQPVGSHGEGQPGRGRGPSGSGHDG